MEKISAIFWCASSAFFTVAYMVMHLRLLMRQQQVNNVKNNSSDGRNKSNNCNYYHAAVGLLLHGVAFILGQLFIIVSILLAI